MPDLNALRSNFRRSRQICRRWRDVWAYMLWSYSYKRWLPLFGSRPRLIRFVFPEPIGELDLTVRNLRVSDSNFVLGEVFQDQHYDIPLRQAPRTILDLGANIGFATTYFSRHFPAAAIACVEPVGDNFELLETNLKANGVKATRFAAAVAVNDGHLEMEIGHRAEWHRVANIRYGKMGTGQTVKVKAISVPSIMQKMGWDQIDLVKVDIEGYEGVLLQEKCEWLEKVSTLCLETHEGFSEAELSNVAKVWGFVEPRRLAGVWLLERARA